MQISSHQVAAWSSLQQLGERYDRLGPAAATPRVEASGRVAAVRSQLAAEAATLQHADAATAAADDAISLASAALGRSESAQARLTIHTATYRDAPLFDGRFTLPVGEGYTLPALRGRTLDPPTLDSARQGVDAFRTRAILPRLGIVREALDRSVDAEAVVRQHEAARQSAAYAAAASRVGATTAPDSASRGGLLDTTG